MYVHVLMKAIEVIDESGKLFCYLGRRSLSHHDQGGHWWSIALEFVARLVGDSYADMLTSVRRPIRE